MSTITFEQFREEILSSVGNSFLQCEPDEDPPPLLFVMHDDKCDIMHAGNLFQDEQGKVIFATKAMPNAIRHFNADYFAFSSTTWKFDSPNPVDFIKYEVWCEKNPGASMADNPIYPPKEQCLVLFGSRDGMMVTAQANIERWETLPPMLHRWEIEQTNWLKDQMEGGGEVRGRMVSFAMEAITGARLYNNESLHELSVRISQTTYMREIMCRAWMELGMEPDVALKRFAEGTEEERVAFTELTNDKVMEIDPDYQNKLRSITEEHWPQVSDQYLEEFGHDEGYVMMMSEDGKMELMASLQKDKDISELMGEDL